MALTTNSLMEEMRDRYKLLYLAGQAGGEHVVTWVHLMEDASVSDLFVGNELVVTSGYAARTEEALLQFVDVIQNKPIAGLVINVGKYVLEVPPSVIEKCNACQLPLLIMPWEVLATEFAKSCCGRIQQDALDEERLNQTAIRAIQTPYYEAEYEKELSEYFDCAAGLQVLVISVDIPKEQRRKGVSKAILRIHTALYRWGFSFLVFMMERRFVLILNQKSDALAEELAENIVEIFARRGWERERTHIGIGTPVDSVTELSKSYHSAYSALRRGTALGKTIQKARDMGFYKLLYSVPDEGILNEYYEERLALLLEYDRLHNGQYVETLFRYLIHDGSLQAVAEEMYTHRNTVNYRMGKIREILGKQLDTQKERFPLLLAFHIGVILERIPDYEASV